MTPSIDKVRENRLRRAARRQRLLLVKSRRRDPRAPDFGLWVLVADMPFNYGANAAIVVDAFAYDEGMTLDEAEAELATGLRP